MRRVALLVLALLAGPSLLSAQARLTTSLDPLQATVGDRLTLTASVEHDPAARVEWPDSLDLSPFEVLDVRVGQPTRSGDRLRSTATFTVTAFELGELELPAFAVEVVAADGTREALSTDAYGVEIVSVGIDESGDLRDIRGPLGIPMSLLRLALWLLLPLLIVAVLWLLARKLRAPEEEKGTPAYAALQRPAHELALEALEALEASPMLERGQVKEYHIEVSNILRTYVERRFRVDALEMTSREVVQGLERVGVEPSFREGLTTFLEQCDMVKFAKVRPDADVSRQVLELGRRLVQRSAPRPEAAASEAAEGAPREEERVAPVGAVG